MHLVAPSLLAADFRRLDQAIDLINTSEADWFHLDVMDGSFVPNISFGQFIIEQVAKDAEKFLDVHLMIDAPGRYIESFAKAGAHGITVHAEATNHLHRVVQQIKDAGCNLITVRNSPAIIEVDGGVGLQNAQKVLEAGARVLVAGSAVFKAEDPAGVISQLKGISANPINLV